MSKRTGRLQNFYPRPPRGGRRVSGLIPGRRWQFLSTPSARRATPTTGSPTFWGLFLSTPSARRATRGETTFCKLRHGFLSTPSARRATLRPSWCSRTLHNFYPRPPRGGRLNFQTDYDKRVEFLSTPSARRATFAKPKPIVWMQISIHALREEGDDVGWL